MAASRDRTGASVRISAFLLALGLAFGGCAIAQPSETAAFDWFAYQGHDRVYDKNKAGPAYYANPVLAGFYPDPSLLRVGSDYYLVTSSFSYFPGLPIFHSRDLVSWTQIGNAIDRPSQLEFKGLGISRGLFAPALDYHEGVFYLINTCTDCGGNYLLTAANPAGPWSDPIWLDFDGIDPSLFFDDDGKAYIVNNGPPEGTPLYQGHRAIWLQEFDLTTRKLVGPRRLIVNGGTDLSKHPIWIEAPHIFRHDGRYYLTCAEGGTADRHSEVVFRADNVWGPYVSYAGNPILTQRDLDPARPDPITSTGHAQLVETQNGDWWAVFLGTRPYEDDDYNTGRETFLLPVHWTADGWPVILDQGKTMPYAAPRPALPRDPTPKIPTSGNIAFRDDFREKTLSPAWLFIRTPHEDWYKLEPGKLVLGARPVSIGSSGQPSFIGWRQQNMFASVSTALHYTPRKDGGAAGLVAFQSDDFYYFLGLTQISGKTVVVLKRRAGASDAEDGTVVASTPIPPGQRVMLKIEARGGLYDFAYAVREGDWKILAKDQDGTVLSTHKAGGFVGTVIGLYAYSPQ
jgi:xylan 1,4-beta-xylosidase